MDPVRRIFDCSKAYFSSPLTVTLSGGEMKHPWLFIYDHSMRVWNLAQGICSEHGIDLRENRVSLAAAAAFHEAGWLARLRCGRITPAEVMGRPGDLQLRQLSADVLTEHADNVLNQRDLSAAREHIVALASAKPSSDVAHALADAVNLEELGLTGLLHQLRAGDAPARSPEHLLQAWQRQQEYHYWDARIKGGFHYQTSRLLAQTRLDHLNQFYRLLDLELTLQDLIQIVHTDQTGVELQVQSDRNT